MHFTAQGWDDLKIKTWEEQKVNGSGRSITALNGIVYSIFIQYYMALVLNWNQSTVRFAGFSPKFPLSLSFYMYAYICHPRNQRPRKKVCFRIHQHSFLWKHFKENMPVAFRLSQKGQSLIWPLPRGWTKRFGASLLIWILNFGYYYFFQNISLGSTYLRL